MTIDPITAALDQLAVHAEQIAQLDAREDGHHAATREQITGLTNLARDMDGQLSALVGLLAPNSAGDGHAGPYVPAPSPRWWKLADQDREQAVGRLRAWVDQVYRPGYGQLTATLGPCWDQHALCLYALDILAELWSVLYLAPARTQAVLAAQAEYQARLLPALAEQMAAETARCPHARAPGSVNGYARSRS